MRVLTFDQLKGKGVPYCRMHIDRLEKAGEFPKRVQLSPNRVAWVESEIDDWIAQRIAARDATGDNGAA